MDSTRVRLADLIIAMSLATDLGMGQPSGHAARTALRAVGVARLLGLPDEQVATVFYLALLRYVGCTADSAEVAALVGDEIGLARAVALDVMGSPEERSRSNPIPAPEAAMAASMRAHCEAAELLARRLPMPGGVIEALGHGFERWDGSGHPAGLSGPSIPIAVRICVVARDVELWERDRGARAARAALESRRGRAYDPAVVDAFREADPPPEAGGADELRDAEPDPRWVLTAEVSHVLEAFADFADLKMPSSLGHSRLVAHLASDGATELGWEHAEVERVRRAALVHDLGRVAVSAAVWNKRGALSEEDWERVRMHPYHSERILARSRPLADLAELAGSHHERLDGSGYFRGSRAPALTRASRLLAAADAYASARDGDADDSDDARAAASVLADVRAGRLDQQAVSAVLHSAGHTRVPSTGPAGLSEREQTVLRLAARGLTITQMANRLGISVKTADRHLQNSYAKIGVSSRAAAAVFAVTHGLLP